MMILGQRMIHRIARTGAINPATGRWASVEAPPVPFLGSVQPLSGRERQELPEGDRQRVTLKVYTTSAVFTANQYTDTPEDVIVIDGERFRVYQVETHGMANLIPHAKVYLVRESEAAPAPVPVAPSAVWDDGDVWNDALQWLE